MKVIIPAAGGGTRFRPLTDTRPKVLLHVAGRPIVGHIIDFVQGFAPEEVVVVTSPEGGLVEQYIRATYRGRLRFVTQPEPKGLGHAVAQAEGAVRGAAVLIILGDTLVDLAPDAIPRDRNALGVCEVPDPRRFGIVETAGGIVTRVVEKPALPRSNIALVGIYYFADSAPLFSALRELIRRDRRTKNEYQLTDALQIMIDQEARFTTFPIEHWLDCGTPATLLEANAHLLRRQTPGRPDAVGSAQLVNSELVPPVHIGAEALVVDSAVGPDVSLGERVTVRNSFVRNSVIHPDSVIEDARLEDSIVGFGARFSGPGVGLVIADQTSYSKAP